VLLAGQVQEQQVCEIQGNKLKLISFDFVLGEVFQRKVRDLKYMQQWKTKQHMRLGVRNNMHQHHFRQQVNF
jgi:hypothetical protein